MEPLLGAVIFSLVISDRMIKFIIMIMKTKTSNGRKNRDPEATLLR